MKLISLWGIFNKLNNNVRYYLNIHLIKTTLAHSTNPVAILIKIKSENKMLVTWRNIVSKDNNFMISPNWINLLI